MLLMQHAAVGIQLKTMLAKGLGAALLKIEICGNAKQGGEGPRAVSHEAHHHVRLADADGVRNDDHSALLLRCSRAISDLLAESLLKRRSLDRKVHVNASDRAEANRKLAEFVKAWRESAPKLAAWAETNVAEGLAVFGLERTEAQRKRLRTTNGLENLNQQIKRRTAVARLFPNEAALLRLASAVLIEISEEWESGRRYLPGDDA